MQDRSAITAQFIRVAIERRDALTASLNRSLKRMTDVVLSGLLVVFTLPLLCIVALLLRLSSSGRIFYAHDRIGKDGRTFPCLKFRTMHPDAQQRLVRLLLEDPVAASEWARTRKLAHDPRVLPGGAFLRRTSLDELPQLFNILRGDMSLVGPRPITRDELPRYGSSARHYLSVKPGLTGLWQISGRNGLSYGERVRLDTRYAQSWSPWGDLLILLMTPFAVLTGRGAR